MVTDSKLPCMANKTIAGLSFLCCLFQSLLQSINSGNALMPNWIKPPSLQLDIHSSQFQVWANGKGKISVDIYTALLCKSLHPFFPRAKSLGHSAHWPAKLTEAGPGIYFLGPFSKIYEQSVRNMCALGLVSFTSETLSNVFLQWTGYISGCLLPESPSFSLMDQIKSSKMFALY